MRILQLCNRVPWPPHDGGAIAMVNMTEAFHKLGHEVHLLCLNPRKHFVESEDMPQLFRDIASFRAVYINTDVEPTGALINLLFSKKSYHISRFKSKAFLQKLIYVLKNFKFDIIQLEGLHIGIYLEEIRKYSKAKVVLRAHNIEFLIWERLAASEKNRLKKWYINILAQRLKNFELGILNKFDAVVPITNVDADAFRKFGCEIPMHVSPAGINTNECVIDYELTDWNTVFLLGALDWMPNLQALEWFLYKVWPKIHEAVPGAIFYVAGRHMPSSVKMLKLPGVEIIGEVCDSKDFMNSKAIMVVPLLSGSGMRIKIIEGMAMGKAIVSTSIGAEGIECTPGENILIVDDANEFAGVVIELLNNKIKAVSTGKSARQLVENKYSNISLVENLAGFYSGLIQ